MTWVRAGIVLTLAAAYFASVFQIRIGAIPRDGLGDWLDPYFINVLLEHWYRSVLTLSDPVSPPMFHPVRGTLGYSHALILYAPIYLLVRPFVDAFQAYTLTLFLVMVLGSCCAYWLLRTLGLKMIEALVLSALFSTSPNVINGGTGTWSQRASVFLIPPILLMLVSAAGMREGRLRDLLAFVSGLLATLLFTQDFYTGQLGLLVLALFAIGVLLVRVDEVRRVVGSVWEVVRAGRHAFAAQSDARGHPRRWWLIVAGVGIALSVLIFVHPLDRTEIAGWRVSARDPWRPLIVALAAALWYADRRWRPIVRAPRTAAAVRSSAASALSAARGTPAGVLLARHWRFVRAFAFGAMAGILVFLYIYLGAFLEHRSFPEEHLLNALWQPDPARWHNLSDVLRDLRRYDSYRPFTFVLLVAMLLWMPWFRIEKRIRLYALWTVVVSALVLAFALKYGTWSLWATLIGWLPGMSVIRDPLRIIYPFELAVVMAAALLLRRLARRSALRIAIAVVAFGLLIVDWNRGGFGYLRDRRTFATFVEAPLAIDPSCRSFFVGKASDGYMARSGHMWSLYAVDSLFISLERGLPTLNGYSAWAPEDWQLANPQEPDYDKAVTRWIAKHGLRDVCRLDIERRTMSPAAIAGTDRP